MKQINSIAIIGAGKMGSSIFDFFSRTDFPIVWICKNNADKTTEKHLKKLKRQYKNDLITEHQLNNKLENQIITENLSLIKNADLIIETITEHLESKQALFKKIEKYAKSEAILTSNSSSILPSLLSKKNEIIGLHFFYPVVFQPMVEIISENIQSDVTKSLMSFFQGLKFKTLLQNNKDAFLLNRILLFVQAEMFNFAKKHNIPLKQIDRITSQSAFSPGLFDIMDQVGADIILTSANNYFKNEQSTNFYNPLIDYLQKTIQKKTNILDNSYGTSESSNIEIEEKVISAIILSFRNAISWATSISLLKKKELLLSLQELLGWKELLKLL
jgi:3-hydroxybutyryl-CoA dehydrogenase